MKTAVNRPSAAGITLIEVLAVVAGVAIIASAGVAVSSNLTENIAEQRLASDVRTINRALKAFEASGGNMGWINIVDNPSWILGQLKADVADSDRKSGFTGSLVDSRLKAVPMTTSAQLDSDAPRAVWDSSKNEYVIIRDNSIAGMKIAGFELSNEPADPVEGLAMNPLFADQRTNLAYDYAVANGWVWDYQDRTASGRSEPTTVPLNPAMAPTASGVPGGKTQLLPPTFSPDGGSFDLDTFDQSVTLTDPNSPGLSEIVYSTSFGVWEFYTGTPISAPRGTRITAFARTLDEENYVSSEFVSEMYVSDAVIPEIDLATPATMTYEEAGGAMIGGGTAGGPGIITLTNGGEIPDEYESSSYFDVFWSFDGSDPRYPSVGVRFQGNPFSVTFPGQDVDISLPVWGNGSSLLVNAAAAGYDADIVGLSQVASNTIGIEKGDLQAPQIREGGGTITMSMVTMFGGMPVGARIFYTTDGTDPGDNNGSPQAGTEYTGPFTVSSGLGCRNETIIARVYGPNTYEHWFNASGASSMSVSSAPSPGSPASIASGFENSALADYGVLGLGDGKLQAKDNAQIWGGIGIGPGNQPDLDGVSVSGNFELDPTAVSGNENVLTLPGGDPAASTNVDLSQAESDAITLSFTAAALTPTQTFAKIDNDTTINATAPDGFNVIEIEEINLGSGKALTLNGGAEDWFILNVEKRVILQGLGIISPSGVSPAHVLINVTLGEDVQVKNQAVVTGTLLAPQSKVVAEHDSKIYGVVVAGKDSAFKNNAEVQAVGFSFTCSGGGGPTGDGTGTQLDLDFTAPTTLTYFEAGGAAMPGGPAIAVETGLVSLENAADIDDADESSNVFEVYWTYDGSDPSIQTNAARIKGGSFAGGYPGHSVSLATDVWTGETLPVQVIGLSLQTSIVTDSAIAGAVIDIDKVELAAPTISYVDATRIVTLDFDTSSGEMPVGARIYYNTDGTFPEVDGSGEPVNALEYTGAFDLATQKSNGCGDYNIIARVYAPAGFSRWFTPSASATLAKELTPTPGTVGGFALDYNTSALSGYAVVGLGSQLEAKDEATVFGNIAFGPGVKRKISALSITGSYDADPTTTVDGDNVTLVSDGSSVSANTTDLAQAEVDAIALSTEANGFTATQTFIKIDTQTTIEATSIDGFNVITVEEINMDKENLILSGGPNDWFIFNVEKQITFKDAGVVMTGGVSSSHVLFNSWNSQPVTVDGDRTVQGTILAPGSNVQIKGDATVEGMLVTGGNSKLEKTSSVVGEGLSFGIDCGDGGGETDDGPTMLTEPVFSIAGGTHPTNAFPLTLTLTNPNEDESSIIEYQVNGGGWSTYSGAISVAANDTIEAFADSLDDGRWTDSATASHTYTPGVPELDAPVISASAPKFDATTDPTVTVSISNPNAPGDGTLNYRVDGGSWQAYAGPFILDAVDYTNRDALVEAQVVATDPVAHADSPVAEQYIYRSDPSKLLKPVVTITPTPGGSEVTITNPNPQGTSESLFVIVPLPSPLGCDIVHGGAAPPGTFISYGAPVAIDDATYPNGFAVIAYSSALVAGFLDSDNAVAYDETDSIGLYGGHFDVDESGRTTYGEVWASWPSGGSTDKHTHQYDNKYDTATIDFFNMGEGHANISDNVAAGERFKVIVVNANLSPLAHLAVNQTPSPTTPYVAAYDDTAFADLPIYSLDGIAGTEQLTQLAIVFDTDAIVNAGLLPSNTGDVKGNTPGKAGEWRNGALTLQVVKVNAAGNMAGGPLDASKSNGDHGAGDDQAVIHELTVFWHWPGDSYHEGGNTYVPASQITIVDNLDSDEEPVCEGL